MRSKIANGLLSLTILLSAGASLAGTITVNGNAEILVVPDEIVVNIGITSRAAKLADAKKENDTVVAALLAAAGKIGIAYDKIQTDYLSISPNKDSGSSFSQSKSEMSGYTVERNVVVTLGSTEAYEEYVAQALTAGANRINGVTYQTSELRQHRDAARQKALAAAYEKAVAMAKVLGQAVGKPKEIIEKRSVVGWWSANNGRAMAQNTSMAAGNVGLDDSATTAVGRLRITAEVDVVFELK